MYRFFFTKNCTDFCQYSLREFPYNFENLKGHDLKKTHLVKPKLDGDQTSKILIGVEETFDANP